MQLKHTKSNKKIVITSLLVGVILIFSILVDFQGYSTIAKKKDDLEQKTEITENRVAIEQLIEDNINLIHKDSIYSIHLVNQLGINNLIFVYKDSLNERQKDDTFFLHVYLKDNSKLVSGKFINLDFVAPEAMRLQINGKDHFIFKRPLASNNHKDRYIALSDIDYINTGRYKPGLNRSQNVLNLKLDDLRLAQLKNNTLPNVNIYLKEKRFLKICSKRDEAVDNGILITEDNDLVKGMISINGGNKKNTELRLKGDLTDHLRSENKWSYRVIMDGEDTFRGLRKFSIQHPRVRNYLWEWLFHKVIKDNDMIGLRYDFIDVNLNIENSLGSIEQIQMGIMALEESFDKILIENNAKREGLILAFDESLLWNDRKKQMSTGLETTSRSGELLSLSNAPIKVFNRNRVLSDPKLKEQFKIAKDLLYGLKEGKFKISEVFDINKLTTYTALSNLFGGHHGLIWHNLRIYYNPITNKLEPISFDTDGGRKITKLQNYPLSTGDDEYNKLLLGKLKLVSSSEFLNRIVEKYYMQVNEVLTNLNSEFKVELDLSILEYNSNFIKKQINPSDALTTNLIDVNESQIFIEIKNLTPFNIEMRGLVNPKGRKLSTDISSEIVKGLENKIVTFSLNKYFDNAFVSKKNKKGGFRYPKDVDKIKVAYTLAGLNHLRVNELIPYGKNQRLNKSVDNYRTMFMENYMDFDFVRKDGDNIVLVAGKHTLDKTMIIPKDLNVTIEEGFSLDFDKGSSFVSYSPIKAVGSEKKQIDFISSNGLGAGIFITNTGVSSKFSYCNFSNLSNPSINNWELSGAVNFHEANVDITNSVFEQNRCEDGLNIIKSEFVISSTVFRDTYSDAFDGDFVKGKIQDCEFINCGNDGIDVSGSQIDISNIVIKQPSDKAISGGEASTITGNEIHILGGEIGIVSKDLSKIELSDVIISNTRLGLSSFQKKSEFGVGIIEISNLKLVNNELDYLIENGSQLSIDNVPVITVSNNVIDQMYGKEYGKSSK